MQLRTLSVGLYEVNCSLLWRDAAQAWLFDPGADGSKILAMIEKEGVKLGLIVLTHAHFDHISAVNEVLAVHPVPVFMHQADVAMAFSPLNAMPPYPATTKPRTLITDKGDGEFLEYGRLSAQIIHTPGHTPGGWCLHFAAEKLLIAGDTLFAGSVGRTDFPGGSWSQLQQSLRKLSLLPPETRVVCGHGPKTTIDTERRDNPYLRDL